LPWPSAVAAVVFGFEVLTLPSSSWARRYPDIDFFSSLLVLRGAKRTFASLMIGSSLCQDFFFEPRPKTPRCFFPYFFLFPLFHSSLGQVSVSSPGATRVKAGRQLLALDPAHGHGINQNTSDLFLIQSPPFSFGLRETNLS